jgi:hypothetical protein
MTSAELIQISFLWVFSGIIGVISAYINEKYLIKYDPYLLSLSISSISILVIIFVFGYFSTIPLNENQTQLTRALAGTVLIGIGVCIFGIPATLLGCYSTLKALKNITKP